MPLPLVVWAAGSGGAAAAAAGATFVAGSSLRFQQGLNQFKGSPPRTGTATQGQNTATLEALIQDAWAGARLPVGFVPPPPQGPEPGQLLSAAAAAAAGAWDAWQWLQGQAGQLAGALGGLWDWLNRPRLPDTQTAWPGLAASQTINYTRSPRAVTYTVKIRCERWDFGWKIYNVLMPRAGGPPAELDYWTPFIVSGIEIWEAQAQDLYGKQWGALNLKMTGTTGAGVSGFKSYRMPAVKNSGSITITPDETNQTGWQYLGNVAAPTAPRPEQLPSFEPAQAPAFPARPDPFAPLAPQQPAPGSDEEWMPEPGTGGTPGDLVWDAPIPDLPGQPTGKPWLNDDGTWNLPQLPTPTVYVPPAVTTWTRTTFAGGLQAAPQAQPQTTATTTHFVNGTAIGGATARATLEAIATELQRVEEKTARLLQEAAKGQDIPISLGELLALVQTLLDYITGQRTAGSYSLQGPCELDASGNRITKTADYEGGYIIDQLSYKLDALAELLQHHKDLKQPICGEVEGVPRNNVTVHFTEVI